MGTGDAACRPGSGDGSAQRERSLIGTTPLFILFLCNCQSVAGNSCWALSCIFGWIKMLKQLKHVSPVADELVWCAASQQTCCKQRWTHSLINLQPKSWKRFRRSTFSRYSKLLVVCRNFNLPNLHSTPSLRRTPFEVCRDLWHHLLESLG